MKTIYDFSTTRIDGNQESLSNYKNKVLLIVNVASECGLTPQYKQLQDLYEKYKDRGFSIVGFPCNQFGAQEPGTDSDIINFCETQYAVSFPMMSKIDVNGANRHEIYEFLAGNESNYPGDITWNFEKFLIDKSGLLAMRIPPKVEPLDASIIESIEGLLG